MHLFRLYRIKYYEFFCGPDKPTYEEVEDIEKILLRMKYVDQDIEHYYHTDFEHSERY